jgi:hypothetical protein
MEKKYLRGVLGVGKETSGYTAREGCKRNRMRVKAGNEWQSLRTKWMKGKGAGY